MVVFDPRRRGCFCWTAGWVGCLASADIFFYARTFMTRWRLKTKLIRLSKHEKRPADGYRVCENVRLHCVLFYEFEKCLVVDKSPTQEFNVFVIQGVFWHQTNALTFATVRRNVYENHFFESPSRFIAWQNPLLVRNFFIALQCRSISSLFGYCSAIYSLLSNSK